MADPSPSPRSRQAELPDGRETGKRETGKRRGRRSEVPGDGLEVNSSWVQPEPAQLPELKTIAEVSLPLKLFQ
jgi:hypothetical protein